MADHDISPGGALLAKLFDSGHVSGSVASIDTGPNRIPPGYGGLLINYFARGSVAALDDVGLVRFNGDSGANYNWRKILLENATVTGQSQTGQTSFEALWPAANSTANIFGGGLMTVLGYASGVFPAVFQHGGGLANSTTQTYMDLYEGWYASTTAIHQVSIAPSSGNLIAGSRLIVYGMP